MVWRGCFFAKWVRADRSVIDAVRFLHAREKLGDKELAA
jgi:hypothetical protein